MVYEELQKHKRANNITKNNIEFNLFEQFANVWYTFVL
jgi:hypothetical protein